MSGNPSCPGVASGGQVPEREADAKTLRPDLRRSLKERPEAVSRDAIDRIGAAAVRRAAKQQFAAAIAIGVDRVDQLHARSDIEMPQIGLREKHFIQLAFKVGTGDQRDLLRDEAFRRASRRVSFRKEYEHGLV